MGNVKNEPGSVGKHVFRLNNTREDLTKNMGIHQIGIETDNFIIAYKDINGDYHTCAAFIDGMIEITPNFALFETTEGNLGIKKKVGETWVDTENVLA